MPRLWRFVDSLWSNKCKNKQAPQMTILQSQCMWMIHVFQLRLWNNIIDLVEFLSDLIFLLIMFYTLVRSLMTFRNLQDSIRERKDRTPSDSRPQSSLPKEPEIISVTFNKVKRSMGLSIVAAKVSHFYYDIFSRLCSHYITVVLT